MTLSTFADKLGYRQWGHETTSDLRQCAKENDFLIIYGCTSDRIMAEGAFMQELEVPFECDLDFIGDKLHIVSSGRIHIKYDEVWTIKCDFQHAIFKTYDNDKLYCKGIIIKLR